MKKLSFEEMEVIEGGLISCSAITEVMYTLRHGTANMWAQADVIQGMLETGTLSCGGNAA